MALSKKIICLFDVDGTLTAPRKVITPEMKEFIFKQIQPRCVVGLVGGSDEVKIAEQMGGLDGYDIKRLWQNPSSVQMKVPGLIISQSVIPRYNSWWLVSVLEKFDMVFSENGLVAKQKGVEIGKTTIVDHVGEEKLQTFINFALKRLSEIRLPVKRGTFVEFRTGLINICPVGRSCSQKERDEFSEFDKVNKIRETLVQDFKNQFPTYGLKYVIGGQISIDVFPEGWDKTYCLKYVNGFDEIHFFGDKTLPGGNDYEIYEDPRTVGHSVTSPDDTRKQLEQLFNLS